MNPVFEAALLLQAFCQKQKWKFCFIGGIVVQRWADPRFTQDADLTLLTGFGNEESFIDPLLATFEARRPDARSFALRNRVLLLKTVSNVPLDIAMGALPFEVNSVKRASRFDIGGGKHLVTCSAEDLIVHKAFAGREQDWADVERILLRQRGHLDFSLIWAELLPLIELKEEPEIEDKLKRLIAKVAKLP